MRPSTPTCKRCTCCGEGLVVVNVGYYYVCYSARQSLYNVDAKEVRSYFTYDRTRNGLLRVCSRLFRLRFVDVSDEVVKWHPDVEVFDVCVVSVIPLGVVCAPTDVCRCSRFKSSSAPPSVTVAGMPQGYVGRMFLDMHPRPDKYAAIAVREVGAW